MVGSSFGSGITKEGFYRVIFNCTALGIHDFNGAIREIGCYEPFIFKFEIRLIVHDDFIFWFVWFGSSHVTSVEDIIGYYFTIVNKKIDIGKVFLNNDSTMKTHAKLKIMEKLYGDDKKAAEAVGVSWHAWRRWKLGERKISLPVDRLLDRLITERAEQS